ncbi:MAG: PKD domain-containing protein, partial [Bacteroidota bacterium]
GSEQIVQYNFASEGEFSVGLSIETSSGCFGFALSDVVVPGLLSFSVNSMQEICADQENELSITFNIPFDVVETITGSVFDEENALIFSVDNELFTLPPQEEGNYILEVNSTSSSGCDQTSRMFIEVVSSFYCSSPQESGDLLLWFDGSDHLLLEGEAVSSWGNKISATNDAVSPSILNSPLYISSFDSLNGRGLLRFDGIDDYMDFGELSNMRTIFFLYRYSSSITDFPSILLGHPTLFQFHGGSQNSLLFSSSFASPLLLNGAARVNGLPQDVQEIIKPNDFEILTLNPNGELTAQYITNDRGSRFWDGDFAELIVFEDSLDDEEIFNVEQYLRYKYAPPVSLPPRINLEYGFCDTSIVAYQPWFRTYEWSTGSIDSAIVVNGPGIYTVEVTDIFGYTSIDSIQVVTDGNFLLEEQLICEFESLNYDTQLDLNNYTIIWSTEENTSSIEITEEGFYSVSVTDTLGCTFTTPEIFVDVDSFPSVAALVLTDIFCLGNDLFLASGFEEAETYLWSTEEDTAFIQPQTSGEYWVEAINANNCVGRDTIDIEIVGVAPEAEFEFTPPCENNDVIFSDITTPDGEAMVTGWDWVFENNESETSQEESPEVFYPAVGEFPVILTVTLDNGCTGTKRDTIFVNQLPLVNFSAPLVCAGNEVFFESFSAVPDGGIIALQLWAFGNDTDDQGAIGSTTFEETGVNTVKHIVTTEAACTDSLIRTVEVLGSPIVDFDIEDICVTQTASFNENVDISVSGPVFYNWQFGDGFFSNFPNTTHDYAESGIYEVTLTATGNNVGANGCVDQVTKQIRVYNPPNAELALTDQCLVETSELIDLSMANVSGDISDAISLRIWTLIDGPTGNQEGFVGNDSLQIFIADAPGTYEMSLEIQTESGCSSTGFDSFLVEAIPNSNFELNLPVIDPPFTATPVNLSEDGISFQWFLNGSLISEEFEPEITFNDTIDYEVVLVATNDIGCGDTAKSSYTVISPFYDLALIDLDFQTQGGVLVLNAIIGNNGNVLVETFDSEIQVGRDINFTVGSEVEIAPGEIINYTLGSEIGYLPGRDLPYTCMRISKPNGQTEIDTTNNYLCIGLNEQRATFDAPFPNPAEDEVKLTVILPEPGQVGLEITGADGKELIRTSFNLEEGPNVIEYPLVGWSEGLYFFKYSYKTQEEVHRLIIAR